MTALPAPGIDRDIYPMPLFATFPVTDLVASTHWYEALGFVVLATMPGPDGPASLVHLRRQRHQDLLLVRGRPTPGPRITVAAGEEDLAARAEHLAGYLAGHPGGAVEGPVDTPWYSSDLLATDPDGYLVVLTAPRLADIAAARDWSDSVVGAVGRRPDDA